MHLFLLFFISFSSQGKSIVEILEESKKTDWTLQQHLKKNIGFFFPSSSSKEKEFIKNFESENYIQSLSIWFSSIRESSFSQTSTGKALESFLLFKNGFFVLALDKLFKEVKAREVHPIVRELWKFKIDFNHSVWDYFIFPFSKEWVSFLNEEVAFKIGSKKYFEPKRDSEYLKYLLSLNTQEKNKRFFTEWKFLLTFISKGDMDSASKLIGWFINRKDSYVDKNQVHLTLGRLLADLGEIEASVGYYEKINTSSPFWMSAQEEMGWLYYKKKDYRKSLAKVYFFSNDFFKEKMTVNQNLLLALSQIKNCDYKNVFKSVKHFKNYFSKKKDYLLKIVDSKSWDIVKHNLTNNYIFSRFNDSFYKTVPYALWNNQELKNFILLKQFIVENKKKNSKNSFTKKMREILKKQEDAIIATLFDKIQKKLHEFALKEIKEIRKNSKLMNLIETEALYHIYGLHSLNSRVKTENLFFLNPIANKNSLAFPFEKEEFWLDEANHYQVLTNKNCSTEGYIL